MTQVDQASSTEVKINHQKFKLCASGTGVIVYQFVGPTCIRILLAMRDKGVGRGHGVTGGGFVECKHIHKSPAGSLFQTADEAHREANEENPGFAEIIPADDFIERAQAISSVHARTDDINEIHAVTMFGLRATTDNEFKRFKNLAAGTEREGSLMEYLMHWDSDIKIDRREPERYVRIVNHEREPVIQEDFWHKHEMHTIACIAWHAQNQHLW
jgi:hypothetical protein